MARFSEHDCDYCAGTGKSFFCEECDVNRPMDCLHAIEEKQNA